MASKRKRVVLSLNDKVEIITQLNKGTSGKHLAEIFGVGSSTISDIKKNSAEILNFVSEKDGSSSRKMMRKAKNDELENVVYKWFLQTRSLGQPISGPIICEKARIFSEELGGVPDFKGSNGWLRNFKARHGIRDREISGETEDETFSTNGEALFSNKLGCLPDLKRSKGWLRNFKASQTIRELEIGGETAEETLPTCGDAFLGENLGDGPDLKESSEWLRNFNVCCGIRELEIGGRMNDETVPTHGEAFTCFEKALKWMERQPECGPIQLLAVKSLQDLAAQKRASPSKQRTLFDMGWVAKKSSVVVDDDSFAKNDCNHSRETNVGSATVGISPPQTQAFPRLVEIALLHNHRPLE